MTSSSQPLTYTTMIAAPNKQAGGAILRIDHEVTLTGERLMGRAHVADVHGIVLEMGPALDGRLLVWLRHDPSDRRTGYLADRIWIEGTDQLVAGKAVR